MSAIIGLHDVLGDPDGIAQHLTSNADVFGLVDAEVVVATPTLVCMWLTLEPWTAAAAEGFPTERVAISVFLDGTTRAVPIGAGTRRWEHRNPFMLGSLDHLGDLCLWYPGDPKALKWSWANGFIDYITIVHRHLMAEEYWRRHGRWPAEAAPHGAGPHPIRSPELNEIVAGAAA